jgi:hypothetical protein
MLNAIANATTAETATAPQATTPIKVSFRKRLPTNQLMAAPTNGAKIIKQR